MDGMIRISSLHTSRPPMTEARRFEVYGKLQPMEDAGEGFDHLPIWQAQPSILRGTAIIALPIVAFVLAIAAFR